MCPTSKGRNGTEDAHAEGAGKQTPAPNPGGPRAQRSQQLLLGLTTPTLSRVGLCPFRLDVMISKGHQVTYDAFDGDMKWLPTRNMAPLGRALLLLRGCARPPRQTRGSRKAETPEPQLQERHWLDMTASKASSLGVAPEMKVREGRLVAATSHGWGHTSRCRPRPGPRGSIGVCL